MGSHIWAEADHTQRPWVEGREGGHAPGLEPRRQGSWWGARRQSGQGQTRQGSWGKKKHIPPRWGEWTAWVRGGSEGPRGGGSSPGLSTRPSPPSQVSSLTKIPTLGQDPALTSACHRAGQLDGCAIGKALPSCRKADPSPLLGLQSPSVGTWCLAPFSCSDHDFFAPMVWFCCSGLWWGGFWPPA